MAQFLHLGMLRGFSNLYAHQEQALKSALAGEDIAAVAGTGSGKTETLFMPVINGLLAESKKWPHSDAPQVRWWKTEKAPFVEQRHGEKREAAVRAIVVYPMNALADDQLVRLRRALDSDEAHDWLDKNRAGNRLYFGRYTGNTPVLGSRDNKDAVRQLAKYLAETESQYEAAKATGPAGSQFYIPRPVGAEMRSRWDMRAFPPDILITNFSMLNIMLMRSRDAIFFESTKEWLSKDADARVTLIIDEAHTYRGTAGTEVSYVLRLLAERLGVLREPERLQILVGSASLQADRDEGFLKAFFARGKDFTFISGSLQDVPPEGVDLSSAADRYESAPTDAEAAAHLIEQTFAERALLSALHQGDPVSKATALPVLAHRLFPLRDDAERLTTNVLKALDVRGEDASPEAVRLRYHLFFRNVAGIWACTNPACPEMDEQYSHPDRVVGKLYAQPTARCGEKCGSRVLELLYCQDCGESYLGGFASGDPTRSNYLSLLPDISDLARLPDQAGSERTAANYVVLWPRASAPVERSWKATTIAFQYVPCVLEAGTGDVRRAESEAAANAWQFVVDPKAFDSEALPASPTRCAACGVDWEIKYTHEGPLPEQSHDRLRSPVRGLRTGFEKINQVLVGEMLNTLPAEKRRLIVFSDSRQDAAKLSAGIGIRHYQDLVRTLFVEELESDDRITLTTVLDARAYVVDGLRTPESRAANRRLLDALPETYKELDRIWSKEEIDESEERRLISIATRPVSLKQMRKRVSDTLVSMGINPGGPYPSCLETREKRARPRPWTGLFDWAGEEPRRLDNLDEAQERLLEHIGFKASQEFYGALAGSAGRDIESIGLGWFAVDDDDGPEDLADERGNARASLRLLILRKRIIGLREGSNNPPAFLRRFWEQVAGPDGDWEAVGARCRQVWGKAVIDYAVDPDRLVVRGSTWEWRCERCRRRHLVRGGGLCTRCGYRLPEAARPLSNPDDDYYAWKALTKNGRFRVATAELTGQTDRVDAQSRQLRFQNVFISGEVSPKADGLDLLSVTTTMEAGVDIGSLETVVLANMPPSRFNYQQRVGRAGRRFSPTAASLTVCRGRSHDETYFMQPEIIANEETPKPYLTLGRPEIFERVLRSEVLRRAFLALSTDDHGWVESLNPHGDFGKASEWSSNKGTVEAWLKNHAPEIADIALKLSQQSGHSHRVPSNFADQLIQDIDREAGVARGTDDLSERLAHAGLLPMFGFPSRVRWLHLGFPPAKSYPWPPRWIVDRDISLAVSSFAPGAETVMDGRIFTAIGVAAYQPSSASQQPKANPNALGDPRLLDMCRSCGFIEDREADDPTTVTCPRCGSDEFTRIDMREPAGFFSTPGRDFDGSFSWSSGAGAVKATADLSTLRSTSRDGLVALSGPGERLVINDRRGRMFTFRRGLATSRWGEGAYYADEASDAHAVRAENLDPSALQVALGASQRTDLLFVGGDAPVLHDRGLRLNFEHRLQPAGVPEPWHGRRAAWFSLAFLLRRVAAMHLDVQPSEFSAGIHVGVRGGTSTVWAFLADTLENGAGFSTHLGAADEFPQFLARLRRHIETLRKPEHAEACSGSCYSCLRDYSNMTYHALLDWRLAVDLLDAVEGSRPDIANATTRSIINGWASAYGGHVTTSAAVPWVEVVRQGKRGVVVPRHVLEGYETGVGAVVTPRVAEAVASAEVASNADAVVVVDTFTLERTPRDALSLLDDALAESDEVW
ncbi:MAG: DEAD/DEAH box helicase [Candidatus Nanopelagicales bacterium]